MKVNLNCELCRTNYNFEVGEPSMNDNMDIIFEHKSICPKCGAKDKDLLSELGQSQMTAWYFKDMRLSLKR